MTYKVYLTNFGTLVYEGVSLEEATAKASKSGFETTMVMTKTTGESSIHSYSPISGWR